jgi:hypothetical protein
MGCLTVLFGSRARMSQAREIEHSNSMLLDFEALDVERVVLGICIFWYRGWLGGQVSIAVFWKVLDFQPLTVFQFGNLICHKVREAVD